MAKKVGELDIELTAKTATLKTNMSSAERIIRSSTRKMSSAAKLASNALSAIAKAAAVGAAGLAVVVKKTAENIDSTAKFADVIGLTTEQLTGYQLAAKITGSSLGQLNTGLQRLQKNIADAEAGLATATREFDRLGISVEDLRELSTDEQLKLIADRFRQLPSTIDRSSVALNLFGRSGIQLSKLLNEGSEGIESFQQEAIDLGIAFNRIDAAKIEEANDAITRAASVSQGFSQQLTIELAPVITEITNQFIAAGKEAGGFGNLARESIDSVAGGVGVLADGLHGIDVIYVGLKAAAANWASFTLGNIAQLNAAFLSFAEDTLGLIGVKFESLTDSRKFLEGISEQIEITKNEINDELQAKLLEDLPSTGIEKALERARDRAQKTAEEVVKVQEALTNDASKNVVFLEFKKPDAKKIKLDKDVADRLKDAEQLFDATRTPLEELNLKMERYNELLEHGSISQDTFNRAVGKAKEEFQNQDPLFQQVKALSEETKDVFLSITSEAIGGVEDWEKRALAAIAKIAIQAAALKLFGPDDGGKGLTSIFQSGLKSIFSFEGGGFTGSGPRVGGLDGKGGFLAMVHPNESYIDHTKPGNNMGGLVQNINVLSPEPSKFYKATSRAALEGRRRLERVG